MVWLFTCHNDQFQAFFRRVFSVLVIWLLILWLHFLTIISVLLIPISIFISKVVFWKFIGLIRSTPFWVFHISKNIMLFLNLIIRNIKHSHRIPHKLNFKSLIIAYNQKVLEMTFKELPPRTIGKGNVPTIIFPCCIDIFALANICIINSTYIIEMPYVFWRDTSLTSASFLLNCSKWLSIMLVDFLRLKHEN